MGDGEEVIVADVGATGLSCVAVEVPLVIAPHPLSSHNVDQESKHEHHREPDASKGRGVLVDSTE